MARKGKIEIGASVTVGAKEDGSLSQIEKRIEKLSNEEIEINIKSATKRLQELDRMEQKLGKNMASTIEVTRKQLTDLIEQCKQEQKLRAENLKQIEQEVKAAKELQKIEEKTVKTQKQKTNGPTKREQELADITKRIKGIRGVVNTFDNPKVQKTEEKVRKLIGALDEYQTKLDAMKRLRKGNERTMYDTAKSEIADLKRALGAIQAVKDQTPSIKPKIEKKEKEVEQEKPKKTTTQKSNVPVVGAGDSAKSIQDQTAAIKQQAGAMESLGKSAEKAAKQVGSIFDPVKQKKYTDYINGQIKDTERSIQNQQDWIRHLGWVFDDGRFASSGKKDAYDKLKLAAMRYNDASRRKTAGTSISEDEIELATIAWKKAYDEAVKQGVAERRLYDYKSPMWNYDSSLQRVQGDYDYRKKTLERDEVQLTSLKQIQENIEGFAQLCDVLGEYRQCIKDINGDDKALAESAAQKLDSVKKNLSTGIDIKDLDKQNALLDIKKKLRADGYSIEQIATDYVSRIGFLNVETNKAKLAKQTTAAQEQETASTVRNNNLEHYNQLIQECTQLTGELSDAVAKHARVQREMANILQSGNIIPQELKDAREQIEEVISGYFKKDFFEPTLNTDGILMWLQSTEAAAMSIDRLVENVEVKYKQMLATQSELDNTPKINSETTAIQANTEAVEENIRAKKKQSKIKVRDLTREEYDAAQEKFQQENDGVLESIEDTVEIIRQASQFGTSFSTQMETSCKRATTAVQRFFSAIDPDKYPALAGWKDSMLESVQNGYFSDKEMYNGMYTGQYSWGVEAIDENRYYVFLNLLDVAKDKEKEFYAYLNEEYRKRDEGLEKESELLVKLHARYEQLNQLHSYNSKWDNNDQITSLKNRLSYYAQERVLLQDIVDLKEELNSIPGKYKSRNTADALRGYVQTLYLGDHGNATLADNERATAMYRAELDVAIKRLDERTTPSGQISLFKGMSDPVFETIEATNELGDALQKVEQISGQISFDEYEKIEQQASATETLTEANNDLANSYLKVQEAAKKSLDVTSGDTFAIILKYYKELLKVPQDNEIVAAQKALIEKAFNGAKTPGALNALQYADDSELTAMGNKLMIGASFEGEFLFKQIGAYLQDVVKSTIDWKKALESVEQTTIAEERLKVEQKITAEKEKQNELIAMHGISTKNLLTALDQSAFPSPSIALTKPDVYSGGYGDATVVFKKSAIDPAQNPANKIYGVDAYTPTHPSFGYELNSEALVKAAERTGIALDELRSACDGAYESADEAAKKLATSIGLGNKLQEAFIKERGFSINTTETSGSIKNRFHVIGDDEIINGVPAFIAQNGITFDKVVNDDAIQQAYFDAIDKYVTNVNEYFADFVPGQIKQVLVDEYKDTIKNARIDKAIYDAEKEFFENDQAVVRGENKVIDVAAYNDEVQKIINNNRKEYNAYVKEVFGSFMVKPNVIGANGQRFDRTPEGIAEAMSTYGGKGALYDQNAFIRKSIDLQSFIIAASKTYESLDEVVLDMERLQKDATGTHTLSDTNYSISGITSVIAQANKMRDGEVFDKILRAVDGNSTAEAIGKALSDNGLVVEDATVEKIATLAQEALKVPTRYFEAKPQRTLGIEDIDFVAIPKDSLNASELKTKLQEKGIKYVEHTSTDKDSRLTALQAGMQQNWAESLIESSKSVETAAGQAAQAIEQQAEITGFFTESSEKLSASAEKSKQRTLPSDLQKFDEDKEQTFTFYTDAYKDNAEYLEKFKSVYQKVRENLANGLIDYEQAYIDLAQETNNIWMSMQDDINDTTKNIKKLSLEQRAKMFDGASIKPLLDVYHIEKKNQNEIYDEFGNLGNMIAAGVDTDSIEAQKSNIVSLILKSAKREVETGLESLFKEIQSGKIYYDNKEIGEIGKSTFNDVKSILSSYKLLTPNRENGMRADEYFTYLSDYAQGMIKNAFEREYNTGFNGSKSNIMQGIAAVIKRAPSKFTSLPDDEQEDVRQRAAEIVDKVASNVENLLQVESKVTDELGEQNEERERGANAAKDLQNTENEKSTFSAEKIETEIDRIRNAIHSSEIGLDQIANTDGLQAAVSAYVKSLDEIDDKKFKLISADINEVAEGVDRVTLKFQSLEDENVKLVQTWAMNDGELTLGRLRTTKTFVDSESNFDTELERTVANSKIDALESQLIGIDHVSQKVTDSLTSLRTAAGNISSDSDIKTFAKNFQVAQNYVREFKNEYKTLGSLANETQNAQAKMANAQETINAQISSSAKYIGVDGYDKVTKSIDNMTSALSKYNEAQKMISDGGLDAEAVGKYEKQMADAFTEYNKAEKQLGAAMKEVRANANFDTFSKSMKDAETVIKTAKLKLDKFGELDGVDKANGYIKDMTAAWKKFNDTDSTIEDKAQAVKDFTSANESFTKQVQYLNEVQRKSSKEPPISKIQTYYEQYVSTIKDLNNVNQQLYAYQGKNEFGIYNGLIEQLQEQKTRILAGLQEINSSVEKEILNIYNPISLDGDKYKFDLSRYLDVDTSNTIKDFFNNASVEAELGAESIQKFIDIAMQSQKIDTAFGEGIAKQYKSIQELHDSISGLTVNGEKNIGAEQMLQAIQKGLIEKLTLGTSWTGDQEAALQSLIQKYTEYVTALDNVAQKQKEYLKNKTEYIDPSGPLRLTSGSESLKEEADNIDHAKEKLTNLVKEIYGSEAIITRFSKNAIGVSTLDYSVFDEATGTLRTFKAEMGSTSETMYNTETTFKNLTSGTKAAEKALDSLTQIMSRLNSQGFTTHNNDYVKKLHDKINQIREVQAEVGTSNDAAGQQKLQNMANDASRLIKTLASLENSWLKVNDAVADGNAEMVGTIGKNEDVYKKMVQLADGVAAAMPGSTLSIDGFNQKTKELTYTIEGTDGQVKTFVMSMDKLSGSAVASVKSIDKAKTGLQEFLSGIGDTGKQLLQYGLRMVEVYDIIRYLRQGFNEVLQIDTAMTELKKVTDETTVAYDNFAKSAYESSRKIGSTMKEFIQATADFARLGYSIDEASQLAEAANVYKNVGDGIDDVAQASESIISTMKAFNIEATDSMGIVDRFNEIKITCLHIW